MNYKPKNLDIWHVAIYCRPPHRLVKLFILILIVGINILERIIWDRAIDCLRGLHDLHAYMYKFCDLWTRCEI